MVRLQIIILCELHQFRVAVDGVHQLDYRHRVSDLKQVTELEVLGDVQLLSVRAVGGPAAALPAGHHGNH